MNKVGFLLLECSIALVLLTGIIGVYGWYLWQSMALNSRMATQIRSTTAMSNYIEQLYADAKQAMRHDMRSEKDCIEVRSVPLPLLTGIWSSRFSQENSGYRVIELHTVRRDEKGKEGHCTWYAGILI